MALGDVTTILAGSSLAIELLASVTATNGVPSTSTDGIDMNLLRVGGAIPSTVRVGIKSTAGSGTMTVAARVWLYFGSTLGWMVGKTLNGGSNIAETGSDTIGYSEEVTTAYGATRMFLEVTAIAGTSTAVTGYVIAAV